MDGQLIGKVTHYYDKIGVAIIELTDTLKVGDKVTFAKGEDEKEQSVDSIQIEKASVDKAEKGTIVGVKTEEPIKEGSEVYRN
ncbi:MAG: translation elongation factor-like protein [Patescibacteria group bacterium]|nr:translation elongation factor-like protein [Patescibacteria group bacterium]